MAFQFNAFRNASIRSRLLIAFVLLVLLLAVAISASAILLIGNVARQDTFEQINSVALLKEAEVNNWVTARQTELSVLLNDSETNTALMTLLQSSPQNPSYTNARHVITQNATRFVQRISSYKGLFLTDLHGRLIWASNPAEGYYSRLLPPLKENFVGPAAYILPSVQFNSHKDLTPIMVVYPVFDQKGETIAIFGGHAGHDWLDKIMVEHAGLGETGETFLVGTDHTLLTPLRMFDWPPGKTRMDNPAVSLALSSRGSGSIHYKDYRGVAAFGVYRWLPSLQVALLVKQDQFEALAPMYVAIRTSLIISLLAVLLAIIAALWITRGIVKPLARLASAARRVAAGNGAEVFPQLFPPDRKDALAVLAQCLSEMTNRLAENLRERTELLAREQAARAEAEAASRAKDEFLATLSHELRTPLTAILGWIQMLRRGIVPPEETPHALDIIERNAWEQSQIVKDLLDVSSIIRGQIRLDVQQVDLASLTASVLDSISLAAQARDIPIRRDLPAAPVLVSGDPARLRQVIWNLLSNAIKFTPEGGRISVCLQRADSHARLSITDSGIGINPEFLPFLFERFRQADSSRTRKYGGLGIGLAIVRHLVELHGGTIRATSAGRGQGATFVLELPVVQPAPASLPAPSAPVKPPPPKGHTLEGVRVLVVDDEPDARELVVRVLKHEGARATAAGSANEALDILDTVHPDVLLSDIAMPGEDGYDLIRKVRVRPPEHGGETPAAALTAMASSEDRIRALSAGYQLHVPKPVEPSELITVVAALAHRIGGNGAR